MGFGSRVDSQSMEARSRSNPSPVGTTRRSGPLLFLVIVAVSLVAGVWVARWSASKSLADGVGAARPVRADVRAQVSLFWGGGARRDWDGLFRLGDAAVVDWVWLTDFEEEDRYLGGSRLPAPEQQVPPGWSPSTREDFGERGTEPELGAWIESATEGEADGLCFALAGPAAVRLALSFGGQAVLETTLEELLRAPIVVPVDSSGNVLLAQAVDLDSAAQPSLAHGGRTAHRASFHTHSCFSTNAMQLEPVVESLVPFVRNVWWTDHNTGGDRLVVAGDFEDADLARRYWLPSAAAARFETAGLDGDAAQGEYSFLLRAAGTGEGDGRAWIELQGGKGAGEFNVALALNPVLSWSWKPMLDSSGDPTSAFVEVELHSGRRVYYLSRPSPGLDPSKYVLVESEVDGWTRVERNIRDDSTRIHGKLGTDGMRRVRLGVVSPPGAVAGVRIDEIELDVPGPREAIRIQREVVAGFDALRSRVGLEQSAWLGREGFGALFPHFIAFVPKLEEELFGGFDHAPTADERRAFVRSIQEAGGCVGTHHMQLDQHYESFLDARGFGLDLFEVGGAWHSVPVYATDTERRARDAHGYPPLSEDEVYPLLVRWDRMTARGLFLSAFGAPDLHQRFDGPSSGWLNRWLSWVLSEDDSDAALLRALRSGQVVASEWRSPAVVSLTVRSRPWMGRTVATDVPRQMVEAHVTGALPGSRLRWIQGALVRDVATTTGDAEPDDVTTRWGSRLSAADSSTAIEVDTRRGIFVRAELLNPAGHLVALSNPIVFTPYWPSPSAEGRIAFDWAGVTLDDERGVVLSEARVDSAGRIVLSGRSTGPASELVFGGVLRGVEGTGGWREFRDPASGWLRLVELPPGPFTVSIEPGEPAPKAPVADPLAIPRRKQLVFAADLGIVPSEEGLELSGFGPPFVEPLGLVHGRVVRESQATFRIPIPAGERFWLRILTTGFSRRSGRLLVDGLELGAFARMAAKTFEVEGAKDAVEERTFTLLLDPEPRRRGEKPDPFAVKRIELWRGEGVVDY